MKNIKKLKVQMFSRNDPVDTIAKASSVCIWKCVQLEMGEGRAYAAQGRDAQGTRDARSPAPSLEILSFSCSFR